MTARMPAVTATKPVQPKNEPQGTEVPLDPILDVAQVWKDRCESAEKQWQWNADEARRLRELNRELMNVIEWALVDSDSEILGIDWENEARATLAKNREFLCS